MSDIIVPSQVDSSPQASQEASAPVEGSSQPAEMQLSENESSQIQEAIDQGASPQEVKSMIKEFKLKVNGRTVTRKIDLADEQALIRELQLSEANKNGMSKARELEKLFEKELIRLKQDPWSVLQELGHDPYALSEKKLNEWVEQQKKSPEQLKYEQMEKELIEARAREARLKEEQEKQKYENLKAKATKEIENEIESALVANPNLPKSGKTISRIVDALQWAYDNGFPDATVNDVIPMVKDDIKREMQEFFSGTSEDLFEEYIGQKNLEKYRKKRISSMKQTAAPTEVKAVARPKEIPVAEKVSMTDFFKSLK